MWAFGVMIYLMLFGRYPFEGAKAGQIAREVQNKQLDWTSKECLHLTECCIDFLSRLLDRNQKTRLTAAQALRHPWISSSSPLKQLSVINRETLELARRLSVDSEHIGGSRVAARVNSKMAMADKEFRKTTGWLHSCEQELGTGAFLFRLCRSLVGSRDGCLRDRYRDM
ncbi:ulk kinase [Cystoisospora suis]|uniref:Ulk kinase n=1 Tax=Cystoisospora suis TaxID=483139 RepID=A0A2C6LG96_9APIC|nr:ulk kinase [Cystoisospora suis]